MADNTTYEERKKLLKDIEKLNKKISDYEKVSIQDSRELAKMAVKRKKLADELLVVNNELRKSQTRLISDGEVGIENNITLLSGINQLERERLALTMQSSIYEETVLETLNEVASINRDIGRLTREDTFQLEERNNAYDMAMGTLRQNADVSQEILDNLESQYDIATRIAGLSERERDLLENQRSVLESINSVITGTLETVITLYGNSRGALAGILVLTGTWLNKLSNINQELGFTLGELNSATISAGALGFIFDDTVGTVKQLADEFGTIDSATLNTQANVGLMASTMGISNEEASKLTGHFARMNNGSSDIAADMIQTTKEYAKQNKVIPSQVLSDLASNAEAFALFAKNGGNNLIQAAVGAKMLGTDLGTVAGIADNLLDFETSMTNELELGAMLGRSINLNKARQLAYDGKITDATNETLKQIGGIAAFNKMDYYQKKQTASLLGITVAEMQKMADNQKNIGTMGSVIQENFSQWESSLDMITNKWLGTGVQTLGGWVAASAEVGANFSRLGLPISGILKGTGKILANLWEMSGGKMLKGLSKVGTSLADNLPGKSIISKTDKIPSVSGDKLGGKGSITDSIGKIDVKKVLAGAAAMVLVAGALWVFGKAVQEFKNTGIEDIGKAVVGMIALMAGVLVLGLLMSSGMIVPLLAGAAAMVIVAGSIWILGKAIQEMATGFDMFGKLGDNLSSLVGMIGGITSLTFALTGLAGSLAVLGTAGLLALPALMGLSLAGPSLGIVANLLGYGKPEENSAIQDSKLSEYETQMLSKMDTLIKAVSINRNVYIDKEKVTSVVRKANEKITGNIFGLNVA